MVGRGAAFSTLTDTWRDVVDGDRGVLALSGAAGVGKSRLAAELAHLASGDDASVLIGRCDAAVPFAATASALGGSAAVQRVAAGAPAGVRARLHPLLPLDPDAAIEPLGAGGSGGPEQRQALARVVEWVLAALAADAPVLLVIEDAERLEEDESNLLGSIATRLPERTLLAICFRDPPGTRHPPLANLLGRRGVHELTRHVALDALSREDLGQLVATVHPDEAADPPAFVEALWQQTAGNPFFARELLRDVDPEDLRDGRVRHGLPVGVRDVLRHRLGLLPGRYPRGGRRGGGPGTRRRADPAEPAPGDPRGAGRPHAGSGADQRVPRRGRSVVVGQLRLPARADAGGGLRRDPVASAPAAAPRRHRRDSGRRACP